MIDLYTWSTPNGRKVSIMLEECGLAYEVHPIDIGKDAAVLARVPVKISPNNKIPAIVDRDNGWSVFESGAILIYLAEKSGRLLPAAPAQRLETLEWLMFQMGGVGPMLGQAHHFLRFDLEDPLRRSSATPTEPTGSTASWTSGWARAEYSPATTITIADIATWPWISRYEWQGVDLDDTRTSAVGMTR